MNPLQSLLEDSPSTVREAPALSAASEPTTISPTLARRFIVDKLLGTGSGGSVFLCRDKDDGGRVKALKVLGKEHYSDDVSLARFYNEAKSAWRIRSEHVVQCFDIVLADGTLAYTMEYVRGENLASHLSSSALTPSHVAHKMLLQIALGLAAIHEQGIVHRDLKPSNVLISHDGRLRIADLGVARVPQREEIIERAEQCISVESLKYQSVANAALTARGGVLGTLDYLSPEYVKHGQLDVKCDIYAFGLIGYQILTREFPFDAPNPYMRILERIARRPEHCKVVNSHADPHLADLVDQCLERDPALRPSAAQIIDVLSKHTPPQS